MRCVQGRTEVDSRSPDNKCVRVRDGGEGAVENEGGLFTEKEAKVSNKKREVSKSAESFGRLVSVGGCTVEKNVCKHYIIKKGY